MSSVAVIKERIFIGIKLSSEIANYLVQFYSEDIGLKGFKWASLNNLHITLRFIGEVDSLMREDIQAKLHEIVSSSHNLSLSKIGKFPKKGPPRIIHTYSQEIPKELQDLLHQIDIILDTFEIKYDKEKFLPHVTLARLKYPKKEIVQEWLTKQELYQPQSFDITSFQLFQSVFTSTGVEYHVLQDYPLVTK